MSVIEFTHCIQCGDRLKPYKRKFCDDKCRYLFNNPIKIKHTYAEYKSNKNCIVCGKLLARGRTVYCSPTCSRTADYGIIYPKEKQK